MDEAEDPIGMKDSVPGVSRMHVTYATTFLSNPYVSWHISIPKGAMPSVLMVGSDPQRPSAESGRIWSRPEPGETWSWRWQGVVFTLVKTPKGVR